MDLELYIVPPIDEELMKFIELSHRWVEEVDKEEPQFEIRRIRNRIHYVDPCFVRLGGEIIAVVRMTYSSFFSFGCSPEVSDEVLMEIFRLLYRDIVNSANIRVRATVNEKFKKYVLALGMGIDFGRQKMLLEIQSAHGLCPYDENQFEKLNWRRFSDIVHLFIDAYSGTIDEEIGMFGPDIAYDAIEQVKDGEFGDVIPDLSVFVRKGKKYIAGLITSITEGELFVVIIGVSRDSQSRGLGRQLLSFLIERGAERGYRKISLWVTEGNERAIKLYSSMGFRVVSKVISLTKYL